MTTQTEPLSALYLADETAWLEAMALAVAERRFEDLDCENLAEYLSDMAIRDRREVFSRLFQLMSHMLKWEFQPDKRSRSWLLSAMEQQTELRQIFDSRTLRNHAESVLDKAYTAAVKQAMAETELPRSAFPAECPYGLDELLQDVQ